MGLDRIVRVEGTFKDYPVQLPSHFWANQKLKLKTWTYCPSEEGHKSDEKAKTPLKNGENCVPTEEGFGEISLWPVSIKGSL